MVYPSAPSSILALALLHSQVGLGKGDDVMTVKQGFKYVALALAGAGIGGLLGVLLAPASGRETRRMVLRRVDEAKDDLVRGGERMFERVADRVEDEIREVRHKIA
jgi:hypothetical protein